MKNLIKRFRDKFHSDLMARFDTLTARMDELNKRLSTLDGQSDVLLSRDDVPNLLPSETVETKFDDLDSIVTLSEDNATRAKYLLDFANSSIKHSGCIPTMLTPYEKRMLYLLAKYYFKGEGAIFDAGICLGGCTEALINGLSKNSVVAGGGGGEFMHMKWERYWACNTFLISSKRIMMFRI
jgi:hypothetical protein